MATGENDQDTRENNDYADDLDNSSDFLFTSRYCAIQNDLKCLYSSMQEFVAKEEFRTHILPDAANMVGVEDRLEQLKIDVMRTECPIVFAGETSSGKSSIINLIVGEKILPTGITASTSRVCRIKHSECFAISTKDSEEQQIGEHLSFENSKVMAEKLEDLARTNVEEVRFVDVYMPFLLLQGNVMIVDTPGCGDQQQQEVANKMRSYLPNALAFVFVANVSNAGGLQDDRLLPVLSDVKDSMDEMVCFSPEDVIFLLNKWETISHESDDKIKSFFEETKTCLRKVWEKIDESNIFKISAIKVSKKKEKYTREFDRFRTTLKEIIARSENKRIKVHLSILGNYLKEFYRVISTKLKCANESAEENEENLDELFEKLDTLEESRVQEISNLERNIDIFLDEASSELHGYLHNPNFREVVLKDTGKFTRISIGKILNTRFENETKAWQKNHIEDIFQRRIMADLIQKYENIQNTLQSIKDNLKGFKTPFDVDNKIGIVLASGSLPSGAGVVASFVIHRMITNPLVFTGIAAAGIITGLVAGGLVALDVVDDFDTVCRKAFEARINFYTKDEITGFLRKTYLDGIKKTITQFLDGNLKQDIETTRDNISRLKNDQEFFRSEKDTLSSLQCAVIQKIERLRQIGRIDITTE